MKVAYVSLWSPSNPKYWSGTPYYSFRAIQEAFPEVVLLDTAWVDRFLYHAGRVTQRSGIDLLREPVVLWVYKRLIQRMLATHKPDVVISVGASHKLHDIRKEYKVLHVADALFATIIESHAKLSGMSDRSKARGDAIQRTFLEKVDVLCLSSDWATRSACSHYDLSHCRVRTLPLGANLADDPGFAPKERFSSKKLSFLFVGGDWEAKGGPLLLQAFALIRAEHQDAELHIVGCTPAIPPDLPGVTVHGFLRKSEAAEAETLTALFRQSSFLFVPTRHEAFGIVFCEACAFGIPPIGTNTGGVSSIIVDNENGILLDLQDPAEEYVRRIADIWNSQEAYEAMCLAARQHFEDRLSWSAWARSVANEVHLLAGVD